jgi:hypothetical protein
MGLLDWLTSDIGSGSTGTGIGGNPMPGFDGGSATPAAPAPVPGQRSFNISPNILQRGMQGLAGGLETTKAGMGPGEAFAQGLGGALKGGAAYDKDKLDRELKVRALENSENDTQGTLDYHNRTLSLQEKKDKREADQLVEQSKAAADFSSRIGGMLGTGGPANLPPASGPSAAPRAPVAPSAKVWGDDEAVAAGLYDPPATPGARPPVQGAGTPPMPPPVPVSQPGADALPPNATPTAGTGMPGPMTPPPAPTMTPAVPVVPGAAPVAPTGAPAAAAPPQQLTIGAQHVPVLIGALSNPNLPAGQKEVAKTLLTEAFKNMKEPEKIQTLRALHADPSLLEVEKQLRSAGKTEVNIDQKSESEFAKQAGGTVAKRFEKLSEEGQNATQDIALLGQLRDLGAVVKTGAPAAIQGWLAERGIKVGNNVSAVEAYSSIIDKLTPQQRIPGSGATSDYEGRMFKNSLPKLINTPEGNSIIENTLAGLSQYKMDRAAIAEKALTREITPAEALKQIREMPSPYESFNKFAKNGFKADPNNPDSAKPPEKAADPNAAKVVPSTKIEIDQSLANARAAIATNPGARSGIERKLRDAGIDPSGL